MIFHRRIICSTIVPNIIEAGERLKSARAFVTVNITIPPTENFKNILTLSDIHVA